MVLQSILLFKSGQLGKLDGYMISQHFRGNLLFFFINCFPNCDGAHRFVSRSIKLVILQKNKIFFRAIKLDFSVFRKFCFPVYYTAVFFVVKKVW